MGLKRIADAIHNGFYRWGWLTPAFLPLAQVSGRGVFNTLSGLYFLWALASLRGSPRAFPQRGFFALYGLMLALWGLSLSQAVNPDKGIYDLLRYVQFSLTGLFTLLALQHSPLQLPRLLQALAASALLLVLVLYLQLPYFLFAVEFVPTSQLHEDNLPWLLPFLLLGLARRPHARWLIAGAIAAVAAYIALSQGRAALLGLLAALAVFALLGFRVRKRVWLATGAAVLALGIVLGQRFFRGLSHFGFDFATLERFTTGRATIWWQALKTPPDNLWLGVGIGNVAMHTEVLRIGDEVVKHLHNFVFDAWFETGLLGLAAFVAVIGSVLARTWRIWPQLDAGQRQTGATALAAVCALLVAGLFSFSYTSKQFALYLYLLLAVLLALPAAQRR